MGLRLIGFLRTSAIRRCILEHDSRPLVFRGRNTKPWLLQYTAKASLHDANFIHRYSDGDIDLPIQSITNHILDKLEKFGDKRSVICARTGEYHTFAQVKDLALRFGQGLKNLGFQKGDVVAVISPNYIGYFSIILGTQAAGGTLAPISYSLTPGEIMYQVINSQARYIVCPRHVFEKLKPLVIQSKLSTRFILIDGNEAGELAVDMLMKSPPINPVHIDPVDDVALLPHSSGTTGNPKGVMLTHYNLFANLMQISHDEVTSLRESEGDHQEVMICIVPTSHIYGIMLHYVAMHCGAMLVEIDKYHPESYIKTLRQFKPTKLHMVPALFHMITSHPEDIKDCFVDLHSAFSAGASLGPTAIERFLKKVGHDVIIMELYGMTEASPGITKSQPKALKYGSIGRTLPNTLIKVIDIETKKIVPPMERGELCAKGPQVMKGYFNNEEATRSTIDEDGWLHTGDIVYCDEEGHFFIVDRLKELIKVKGLQVAPTELEDLIRKIPDVLDVGVVAVPDEYAGELPKAFVVRKSESLTEKVVADFVAANVAKYKQLKGGVTFIDAIPRNNNGKILRRVLKEMATSMDKTMR